MGICLQVYLNGRRESITQMNGFAMRWGCSLYDKVISLDESTGTEASGPGFLDRTVVIASSAEY